MLEPVSQPLIQNVPDDVLHEIFLQCLPEHDVLIGILPSNAPVLLTHICRRWRRIALEFSGLWTSLKLTFQSPKMLERTNLQAMAEVLKRFKKSSASLQIAVASNFLAQVNILDPLVVPFTASLTSLVLRRIPISQIHALPSGLFPCLKRLVLYISEADFNRSTPLAKRPIVAFEDAPALRHVATNNLFLDQPGVVTLRLPWHQLTHFISTDNHDGAPQRFIVKFLPQCVALQRLYISLLEDVLGEEYGDLPGQEPVTMPTLKSLTVNWWGSYEGVFQYPDFFDDFKFAGLRSLRLQGSRMEFDNLTAWNQDQVDKFLDKIEHEFRLEYLSICQSSVTRVTLEKLFKVTPYVTMLDAHIHENYEHLFETLTICQDPDQSFLPQLKTLVLELGSSVAVDECEGETIDPDTFADFLDSRMRCASGSRLRKIVLYGGCIDDISDEVPFVEVIQRYIPAGLSLERHVVAELRDGKLDDDWMERDPDFRDWLEASALFKI